MSAKQGKYGCLQPLMSAKSFKLGRCRVPAGTVTVYFVAMGKRSWGLNITVRVPIQRHSPG